jgi:uncharacterized protein (DUF433 family)
VSTAEGWRNPRLHLPAYRFSDAARLAQTSATTIARWYRGYSAPGHQMAPVLPVGPEPRLSYLQLVEAALVADFRREGVRLERLRRAHEYLRETRGVEYPFAQWDFRTDGVHVFADAEQVGGLADASGRLIATDMAGQLAWGEVIQHRLDQFDYEQGVAVRWHPRGRGNVVLVDPRIAFGAPIIATAGVPTSVLKQRVQGGETISYLADDYKITEAEVMAALEVEGAALLAA